MNDNKTFWAHQPNKTQIIQKIKQNRPYLTYNEKSKCFTIHYYDYQEQFFTSYVIYGGKDSELWYDSQYLITINNVNKQIYFDTMPLALVFNLRKGEFRHCRAEHNKLSGNEKRLFKYYLKELKNPKIKENRGRKKKAKTN